MPGQTGLTFDELVHALISASIALGKMEKQHQIRHTPPDETERLLAPLRSRVEEIRNEIVCAHYA
ncbi:MAG: hypothetical protein WC773_02435 [Patescibacteria group bacterium]|jgi:hypothetical protein